MEASKFVGRISKEMAFIVESVCSMDVMALLFFTANQEIEARWRMNDRDFVICDGVWERTIALHI